MEVLSYFTENLSCKILSARMKETNSETNLFLLLRSDTYDCWQYFPPQPVFYLLLQNSKQLIEDTHTISVNSSILFL